MSVAGPQQRFGRTIRVAVQVVGVLGVLAVIGAFLSFRNYVNTSPRFCQTCHVIAPEIAIWTESEHRTVRCQECHHHDLREGLGILTAYLTGGTSARSHASVNLDSCAGCHAKHDARWKSISNSIGHRIHVDRAKQPCTTCHGQQMHFSQPARETCAGCHASKSAGAVHERAHCLACHNFLSTDEIIRPTRADCLRCHETRERPIRVNPSSPMQFACSTCHRPHSQTKAVPCSDCHQQRDLPGLHRNPGHQVCARCHKQHDWTATRTTCFECHKTLKTHYPDRACGSCHSFEAGVRTGP
jgi:hypothetical protein